jgi:Beta-xylosidase
MVFAKKPYLLATAMIILIGTALILLFRFAQSGQEASELPQLTEPPYAPAAYLKESDAALSGEAGSEFELRLLMDELPGEGAAARIEASVRFPEMFAITGVVPNTANLKADDITFTAGDGGAELVIRNADGSAIALNNQDSSKELLTMKLKLNRELTTSVNEKVNVDKMNIVSQDDRTIAVDVSGAEAKVSYAPPARAVGKLPGNGNPLVSHKFGADPYALVYDGRVYLYMTNDVFEYDAEGNVKENTYGKVNKIAVISSDDLVNWTDHGVIHAAGPEGAAKWATQSWAPAAVHREIDGEDRFFLYFANNASGVGVLTSDSPTGPWTDPIGKPLIARSTPGVEDVTWIFDPAVLVDDDGKAYIYFGGGIPEGRHEMPNTARVMQLGDDMVSVVDRAVPIPAPYMFENSGINKVNGRYYYTYCSNFIEGDRPNGPLPGQIAYMVSDSPMGPWTYMDTILKNPGHFFQVGGNNHHAIFQFHDSWYIAYHAQTLSKAMGHPKGYRSTHLNQVFFKEDGTIQEIEADYKGVAQVKTFNPYERVAAAAFGWNAGVNTEAVDGNAGQLGLPTQMAVTGIENGDWIALSQVDFGSKGASSFTASVLGGSSPSAIELRLDGPDGERIGTLPVPAADGNGAYAERSTEVAGATGVHDLYMVFRGNSGESLMTLKEWQFAE